MQVMWAICVYVIVRRTSGNRELYKKEIVFNCRRCVFGTHRAFVPPNPALPDFVGGLQQAYQSQRSTGAVAAPFLIFCSRESSFDRCCYVLFSARSSLGSFTSLC
uniref:Uncharacterized protein n=1 Tax=Trypanosoma vivax (strain Y486) TaxID=1055687 RepID=G0TY07_TRYVY|nr:hypothetical protein TVY486_0701890 [Trypanosoma vivax Y486]